jgi:hypothetical protein
MIFASARFGLEALPHPVPRPFEGFLILFFIALAWIMTTWMFVASTAGPFVIAFACWKAFHDYQRRKAAAELSGGTSADPRAPLSDGPPESNRARSETHHSGAT